VNEELTEPKAEESPPELPAEGAPEETLAAPVTGPVWLRLAYSIEFLIALLAIFTVWSQVGGQGHLDLLPWYAKLILSMSMAWCCVRFTAGIVEHESVWTARTIFWLAAMLLLASTMAAITFYYHLHEEPDGADSDENTATTVSTFRSVDKRQTIIGNRSLWSRLGLELVGYKGVRHIMRVAL
jgi:hypothetical protein